MTSETQPSWDSQSIKKGNEKGEIKMESIGDFASVLYKFAKFDGPYAVETPTDHYSECFL